MTEKQAYSRMDLPDKLKVHDYSIGEPCHRLLNYSVITDGNDIFHVEHDFGGLYYAKKYDDNGWSEKRKTYTLKASDCFDLKRIVYYV